MFLRLEGSSTNSKHMNTNKQNRHIKARCGTYVIGARERESGWDNDIPRNLWVKEPQSFSFMLPEPSSRMLFTFTSTLHITKWKSVRASRENEKMTERQRNKRGGELPRGSITYLREQANLSADTLSHLIFASCTCATLCHQKLRSFSEATQCYRQSCT